TVLMSIPQFLQIDVQQLMQDVQSKTAQRLQELDILTVTPEAKLKKQVKTTSRVDWSKLPLIRQGKDVDLLAHVLNEQIDIRLIDPPSLPPTMYQDHRGMRIQVRLLDEVLDWPLDKLRKKTRHCRLCNSAFDSVLPAGEMTISGTFSPDFTDAEHIGFGGDICPMCRIYALNSHKSRTPSEKADGITGDRKGYRGAFALVTPSSHFAYRDDQNTLVEKQPPLDIGGRFSGILQRATFTLQEFMLFNALSRRVIAKLWQRLYDDDQTRPLSLPYLGAILLTQKRASDVRELFEYTEMLFSEVKLRTYPFQTTVRPAIEFIFEMAINDRKQHHTKHTYLKTNPMTMMISPDSKFTLLVDNALQLEVSRQFFADRKHLGELLSNIKGKKRRRDWLSSVLQGNDPVTATAEAFYDRSAFRQAENTFWEAKMGKGSPAEQWRAYEEVKAEIREIVSRYPLVIEFFINPKR
ncbi:MAG: hypothetical protein U9Q82_03660, partial [Chloroflexota bacterium]|nr:hypothetical protein [Chloroflexota bacterium]